MQKIILTEKTVGTVMDRLGKIVSSPFRTTHDWDRNPLKKSAFKQERYRNDVFREAKVTKHWMSKDKRRKKQLLIHIDFLDGMHMNAFEEGDIFYFFGGNKLIIRRLNDVIAKTLDHNHVAYIILREDISESDLVNFESDRSFELSMYEDFFNMIGDDY